jgi:hypothetical protein
VEAGVDAGQVEGGRVEVRRVFEAEPLKYSLVLLVGRVGDRLFQVSEPGSCSDTTGVLAGKETCGGHCTRGGPGTLWSESS